MNAIDLILKKPTPPVDFANLFSSRNKKPDLIKAIDKEIPNVSLLPWCTAMFTMKKDQALSKIDSSDGLAGR